MIPLVHIFFSRFFLFEFPMSEGTGKITLASQFTEKIRHFTIHEESKHVLNHEESKSIYGSQKK